MDNNNNFGAPPAILPEQFQYSVFYKLGAIESQLLNLNTNLNRHVTEQEKTNERILQRLTSLETWRTQVNTRAGALGAFVGTIASMLVVFADKYLIPLLGKISGGF